MNRRRIAPSSLVLQAAAVAALTPHPDETRRLDKEDADVAVRMGPLGQEVCGFLNDAVGAGRYEVFVLVNAGRRMHYVGNVPRERGSAMLGDLLALWRNGFPDMAVDQLRSLTPADRLARLMVGRVIAAYTEAARANPGVIDTGFPDSDAFRAVLEELCESTALAYRGQAGPHLMVDEWREVVASLRDTGQDELAARVELEAALVETIDEPADAAANDEADVAVEGASHE